MVSIPQRQSSLNLQPLVDQIISGGQLSRQEYLQMTRAILSDYNVTEEERRQINHLFDDVQAGRLQLVD